MVFALNPLIVTEDSYKQLSKDAAAPINEESNPILVVFTKK